VQIALLCSGSIIVWLRLRVLLIPKLFLAGIVVGFAACCIAGRYCAANNPFEGFHRLYRPLSAETFFYITVSQMVSLLKQNLATGRVVVIVAGDSVAEGRGQGKELWSDKLQAQLGSAYQVVNLAQAGMPAFTGPYLAFLNLAPKNQNLYYVGFTQPLYVNAVEYPFQGYPYWWDAYFKGLIPFYPRLSETVADRLQHEPPAIKEETEEAKIGSYLDSLFYFQDLWTTVAYKMFFTVWTKHTAQSFMMPRKEYPDQDDPPLPVELRMGATDFQTEKTEITRLFPYIFTHNTAGDKLEISRQYIIYLKRMISDTVPEQLRSQMLIVQVRTNPEVSKKVLRANEQNGLYEASQLSETIFKEVGIEATFEGKGYRLEDYLDGRHLSASGGEKLSAALAKKIIELNRKNISRQQTSRSP
jgi:hypothetical protein